MGLDVIEDSLSIKELLEKYQRIVAENSELKEENKTLKARLTEVGTRIPNETAPAMDPEPKRNQEHFALLELPQGINNNSDAGEKVRLFMSLFKGRDDVYAKRWESKQKEKSGYSLRYYRLSRQQYREIKLGQARL